MAAVEKQPPRYRSSGSTIERIVTTRLLEDLKSIIEALLEADDDTFSATTAKMNEEEMVQLIDRLQSEMAYEEAKFRELKSKLPQNSNILEQKIQSWNSSNDNRNSTENNNSNGNSSVFITEADMNEMLLCQSRLAKLCARNVQCFQLKQQITPNRQDVPDVAQDTSQPRLGSLSSNHWQKQGLVATTEDALPAVEKVKLRKRDSGPSIAEDIRSSFQASLREILQKQQEHNGSAGNNLSLGDPFPSSFEKRRHVSASVFIPPPPPPLPQMLFPENISQTQAKRASVPADVASTLKNGSINRNERHQISKLKPPNAYKVVRVSQTETRNNNNGNSSNSNNRSKLFDELRSKIRQAPPFNETSASPFDGGAPSAVHPMQTEIVSAPPPVSILSKTREAVHTLLIGQLSDDHVTPTVNQNAPQTTIDTEKTIPIERNVPIRLVKSTDDNTIDDGWIPVSKALGCDSPNSSGSTNKNAATDCDTEPEKFDAENTSPAVAAAAPGFADVDENRQPRLTHNFNRQQQDMPSMNLSKKPVKSILKSPNSTISTTATLNNNGAAQDQLIDDSDTNVHQASTVSPEFNIIAETSPATDTSLSAKNAEQLVNHPNHQQQLQQSTIVNASYDRNSYDDFFSWQHNINSPRPVSKLKRSSLCSTPTSTTEQHASPPLVSSINSIDQLSITNRYQSIIADQSKQQQVAAAPVGKSVSIAWDRELDFPACESVNLRRKFFDEKVAAVAAGLGSRTSFQSAATDPKPKPKRLSLDSSSLAIFQKETNFSPLNSPGRIPYLASANFGLKSIDESEAADLVKRESVTITLPVYGPQQQHKPELPLLHITNGPEPDCYIVLPNPVAASTGGKPVLTLSRQPDLKEEVSPEIGRLDRPVLQEEGLHNGRLPQISQNTSSLVPVNHLKGFGDPHYCNNILRDSEAASVKSVSQSETRTKILLNQSPNSDDKAIRVNNPIMSLAFNLMASPTNFEERNFAEWDPHLLLRALYEVNYNSKAPERVSNNCINMEGPLECISLIGGRLPGTSKQWKTYQFNQTGSLLKWFEADGSLAGSLKLCGHKLERSDQTCCLILLSRHGKRVLVLRPAPEQLDRWARCIDEGTQLVQPTAFLKPIFPPIPHLTSKVVVVELGSCSIRAGFLTSEPSLPNVYFPCVAAKLPNGTVKLGADALSPSVIRDATLVHPITPTQATSVNRYTMDMIMIYHVFAKVFEDLSVIPSNYQVLLSVPQTTTASLVGELLKLLLNAFRCRGVAVARQPTLVMYAYDATSGVVVDIGDHLNIVPIVDGFAVSNAIVSLPYGGFCVAQDLRSKLREEGSTVSSFSTSVEKYVLRYIAEKACYVALDFNEELIKYQDNREAVESVVSLKQFEPVEGMQNEFGASVSRFASSEGLFAPKRWCLDVQGLHKLVNFAIQSCPIDSRKGLYRAIYLAGGTALLPGLADRLEAEVQKLAPLNTHVQVHTSPWLNHAAFLGAQVLAGTTQFEQMLVTQSDLSAYIKQLHLAAL